MAVWITHPKVSASDFNDSSAVFALAFPADFVGLVSWIGGNTEHKKMPKFLSNQVMFQNANVTSAGTAFSGAETFG